ncbi:MAG: hypothetical protein GY804_09130 [Alphaproteobacteria bacterium]|nr:hypothetical protein [Alphaproteobacteria bacterium]
MDLTYTDQPIDETHGNIVVTITFHPKAAVGDGKDIVENNNTSDISFYYDSKQFKKGLCDRLDKKRSSLIDIGIVYQNQLRQELKKNKSLFSRLFKDTIAVRSPVGRPSHTKILPLKEDLLFTWLKNINIIDFMTKSVDFRHILDIATTQTKVIEEILFEHPYWQNNNICFCEDVIIRYRLLRQLAVANIGVEPTSSDYIDKFKEKIHTLVELELASRPNIPGTLFRIETDGKNAVRVIGNFDGEFCTLESYSIPVDCHKDLNLLKFNRSLRKKSILSQMYLYNILKQLQSNSSGNTFNIFQDIKPMMSPHYPGFHQSNLSLHEQLTHIAYLYRDMSELLKDAEILIDLMIAYTKYKTGNSYHPSYTMGLFRETYLNKVLGDILKVLCTHKYFKSVGSIVDDTVTHVTITVIRKFIKSIATIDLGVEDRKLIENVHAALFTIIDSSIE